MAVPAFIVNLGGWKLLSFLLQFLLAVSENFGDQYVIHMLLPVFLEAMGDHADLTLFPSSIQSRIKGMSHPSMAILIGSMCHHDGQYQYILFNLLFLRLWCPILLNFSNFSCQFSYCFQHNRPHHVNFWNLHILWTIVCQKMEIILKFILAQDKCYFVYHLGF